MFNVRRMITVTIIVMMVILIEKQVSPDSCTKGVPFERALDALQSLTVLGPSLVASFLLGESAIRRSMPWPFAFEGWLI